MRPRVPTYIPGFDELVEDGFSQESLILLVGNPGSGKSIFAAQFLYEGATRDSENGVYVSFSETRVSLLRNLLRFGWDYEKLETDRLITILDLSSTKEMGIQGNLNRILETIKDVNANRLVIDSITALTLPLEKPADVRFLIHLLYRFLQQVGCTTIMVSDSPWGSQQIGFGVEEFIADGLIIMRTDFDEDGILTRTMRILKMRTTKHSKKTIPYDITDDGIQINEKRK
jgi:circadian clock protein KaiC